MPSRCMAPPCFALIRDSASAPYAGLHCVERTSVQRDCVFGEEDGHRVKRCRELQRTFRTCGDSLEEEVSTCERNTTEREDSSPSDPPSASSARSSSGSGGAASSVASSTSLPAPSPSILPPNVGQMIQEFLAFSSDLERNINTTGSVSADGGAGIDEPPQQQHSQQHHQQPAAPTLWGRLFGRATPHLPAGGLTPGRELVDGQLHYRQFSYTTQDI